MNTRERNVIGQHSIGLSLIMILHLLYRKFSNTRKIINLVMTKNTQTIEPNYPI